MKTYAIFYNKSGYSPCGDRSIIQIDGRLSSFNIDDIALTEQLKRGFDKYSLFHVNNLRDIPDNQFAYYKGLNS